MRALPGCFALFLVCSANAVEPDKDLVKQRFQSKNYTVAWGAIPKYEPETELEIGDGYGHGGGLGWIRFLPGEGGVDVLSIKLEGSWDPYDSKWRPDRAPVDAKRAKLKSEDYAALLGKLAIVDSITVKPVLNELSTSFSDFWVFARLTTNKKTLLDLNWAGYEGGYDEAKYAKPRAAVDLTREAIKALEFKDHVLTDEERDWASAKFTRDWKKFTGLEFHWWVRERYIETIGVVGNKAALPVLQDILATEPPKGKPRDASDSRCIYLAINAVTRLTKKDVRERPVENMDIEKTRLKVLDLIKEMK